MRRWISLLLTLALILSLAACGSAESQGTAADPSGSNSGSTAEAPVPTGGEASAEESAEGEAPAAGAPSSVLIAYFSATGNTENIAEHLVSILDADLYEIVPEMAGRAVGSFCSRLARQSELL